MIDKPFALITGGSTGIGRSLARLAAFNDCDMLIVADEPVADDWPPSTVVNTLIADLSTAEGRQLTMDALQDRVPDLCLANAGRGLGGSFAGQSPEGIRKLLDTNVVGTTMLVHQVAQGMIRRGSGRIMLTGSIVGAIPGPFQAVYNASKAYVNLLAAGLHDELVDHGISVTCLKPGATETPLFRRAGLTETWLGRAPKSDPDIAARAAWRAMMGGRRTVVPGWHNKALLGAAAVLPSVVLASLHRAVARPRP